MAAVSGTLGIGNFVPLRASLTATSKAKTLEVKLTAVDQKMEVTFGNSVLSVGAEPVDDGKPGKKKKGGEGPPDQLPPM